MRSHTSDLNVDAPGACASRRTLAMSMTRPAGRSGRRRDPREDRCDPRRPCTERAPPRAASSSLTYRQPVQPCGCAAAAHAAVAGSVPGVVDPAGARAGDPQPGPVVLHPDGRAPRLAAAHPRPVVSPGLPADQGAAVGGGPRCVGQHRTVINRPPIRRHGAAAH